MTRIDAFESLYVQGRLPDWYMCFTSAARMLTIKKRVPEPNGTRPPVRPVAPGNVSRSATTRAVVSGGYGGRAFPLIKP